MYELPIDVIVSFFVIQSITSLVVACRLTDLTQSLLHRLRYPQRDGNSMMRPSVVGAQNEFAMLERQAGAAQTGFWFKSLEMRARTQPSPKEAKKYRKSNSAVISFTQCAWNS